MRPSFADFVGVALFSALASGYYQPLAGHEECAAQCDFHETQREYEDCIKRCTGTFEIEQRSAVVGFGALQNATYPAPPTDLRVQVNVIVERSEKILQAVVHWSYEPDQHRTGFYLRVLATSEWCEQAFSGYYAQNIGPVGEFSNFRLHRSQFARLIQAESPEPSSLASSHPIPLELAEPRTLKIMHNCTYEVQMHSKPYPYADDKYKALIYHWVPPCVDGYCSCRSQKPVPEPRQVEILTFYDPIDEATRVMVNWTFRAAPKLNDTYEFHLKLAKRFRPTSPIFKESSAFRFVFTSMEHIVKVENGEQNFSTVLPVSLHNKEEYRLSIATLNQHICKSETIKKEFSTIISALHNESDKILPTNGQDALGSDGNSDMDHDVTNQDEMDSFSATAKANSVLEGPSYSPLPSSSLAIDTTTSTVLSVTKERSFSDLMEYPISILLICALLLIISICALLLCRWYIRHEQKLAEKRLYIDKLRMAPWSTMNSSHSRSIMEANIIYTDQDIAQGQTYGYIDKYEMPYERLRLGRVIGQGAFGLVYMGMAEGINGVVGPTTVAIKQLKANADESEREEFIAEMEILKQIGRHPNIVALYGCCTIQHPQCVIMEYIPYGDLKRYLQNLRKQYERALEESMRQQDYVIALSHHRSPSLPVSLHSSFVSHHDIELPFVDAEWPDLTYSLDPAELESFAIQVANGMAHIESLGITHRDLAARNILVGHGKLLKISDFGLSRHGVYVKTTRGVIPLRWLSVEAMRDNIYSNKSDVWAYGVVLWEICTLGGFPYPTTSDKDLVRFLESGGRLEKPASCSDQVYELMMECWSYCAEDRPSFAELRDRITDLSNQGSPYVEFADRAELPPPEGYCVLAADAVIDRSTPANDLHIDRSQSSPSRLAPYPIIVQEA